MTRTLAAEFGRPREEVAERSRRAGCSCCMPATAAPAGRDDKVLTSWNGLMIARLRRCRTCAQRARASSTSPARRPTSSWPSCAPPTVASSGPGRTVARNMPASSRTTRTSLMACWHSTRRPSTSAGSWPPGSWPTWSWTHFARRRRRLLRHRRRRRDALRPATQPGGQRAARRAAPWPATVLLRLAALTGDGRYRRRRRASPCAHVGLAAEHPTDFAQWLIAYQLASSPIDEVAIVGEPGCRRHRRPACDDIRELPARPGSRALSQPGCECRASLAERHSRGRHGLGVRGFACQRPTTDPTTLAVQLA